MPYLVLFLKGIAVGAANIIPGVSGATLAVIFRVYDRLIWAINHIFKDFKGAVAFAAPFGAGMAIGIFAFVAILDYLLIHFSLQFGALMAGLMAGSIPFLHKTALTKMAKSDKKHYVITVVAALFIIATSLFMPATDIYVEASFSVGLTALLFFGGILSAAALIIPGVSGAMVLIILGIFPIAIHTLGLIREYVMTPFDFSLLPPIIIVVAPIGVGLLVGAVITSRLIAYLLEKHHSATYFAIIGLIFGTVFALFNNEETYQSVDVMTPGLVFFAAVVFAVGLAVSLLLGKK